MGRAKGMTDVQAENELLPQGLDSTMEAIAELINLALVAKRKQHGLATVAQGPIEMSKSSISSSTANSGRSLYRRFCNGKLRHEDRFSTNGVCGVSWDP